MDPISHVEEADVDGESPLVTAQGLVPALLRLERPTQPVDQPDLVFIAARQTLGRPPENGLGDGEARFLEERDAQLLRRLEPALGRSERLLELRDRLVEETHLLEGDPEIVMRLEIFR